MGQTLRLGGLAFGTIKLMDGADEVGGLMLSLGPMNFVLITSTAFGHRRVMPPPYIPREWLHLFSAAPGCSPQVIPRLQADPQFGAGVLNISEAVELCQRPTVADDALSWN